MEEIAEVYSRALFEAAQEAGTLDDVKHELAAVSLALDHTRDLQVFFFSPYFSVEEKRKGLARVFSGADETMMRFLDLLLENHRMPLIHRIHRQYDERWEQLNRRLPVQVTSAIALDEATVQRIGAQIGERTGQHVELSSHVDPDILGGIVLRVGNSILDASIKTRLDQLRMQVARN
jgi:ATP synthase F1 delta subunit